MLLILIRRIILDVLRVPGLCVTRRAAGLTMARRRPSAGCAWSQIKKLDTAEGTNIALMPPDARVVQRNAGPTAQCRNPTTAIMHCTTALLHYCTTTALPQASQYIFWTQPGAVGLECACACAGRYGAPDDILRFRVQL